MLSWLFLGVSAVFAAVAAISLVMSRINKKQKDDRLAFAWIEYAGLNTKPMLFWSFASFAFRVLGL